MSSKETTNEITHYTSHRQQLLLRAEAIKGIQSLIRYLGDDPDRPGLLDTPERVLNAWLHDWGIGYNGASRPTMRLFPQEGKTYDQMVLVTNIHIFSHCEHHMTPFFGRADIAYIPNGHVLGLSKIARIVNWRARRLQVQERLTTEVADDMEEVSPNVGVVMRCKHMCMISRGVQQPESSTTTSALRGAFKNEPECRAEFLKLIGI
jgi:GTP cyclohydrolase I